jgi:hypothetical protein
MTRSAAAVLPGIEALLSCRLGDDPPRLAAFWNELTADFLPHTSHVFDSAQEGADPLTATPAHHLGVREAFRQCCEGSDRDHPVRWTFLRFQDIAGADEIPTHTCTCSIGRIGNPTAPRGLSLTVTVPKEREGELAPLACRLAARWPGLWRWISVGLRFVGGTPFREEAPEELRQIRLRSRRLAGVDVGDPFGILTSYWQDRLRTVNWISLVSDDLARSLAGDRRGPDLPRTIHRERLSGGILLRAGDRPSLCDRSDEDACQGYVELHRALEPIVADDPVVFPPFFTVEETREWLRRFAPRWED